MSGVLVLQPFVVSWIKEQSISVVLYLFRRALVPLHGFSVLFFDSGL